MLTKIEMEDIWNNKPVDYLKDFMKKVTAIVTFLQLFY
jgi:hypothetical protein